MTRHNTTPDITYNGDGLPQLDPSTYDRLPPVLQEKFDVLEDLHANAHSAVEGATAQLASATDDFDRAKGTRDKLGPDADERQKKAADDTVARARKRLDLRHEESPRSIRLRESIRTVTGTCARKVEGARTYAPMPQRGGDLQHVAGRGNLDGLDLRIVSTVVPKGATLPAVSAEIDALRTHRADLANAPAPREFIERRLLDDLDAAARRGGIGIDIGRDGLGDDPARHPGVTWPTKAMNAPSNSDGSRVMAIDVEALVARHLGDAIRAEIRAKLDKRYADVALTLDAHEKGKRLRAIDAKLLELARVEASLIWRQIRSGDTSIFFRPDADPRAVLGIA